MAQKILVADDSLTVQKVVSLTLASFDYELVECKDESQLAEQLMIGGASILLLDLNLSEGKSGYDVAKEVRSKYADLPIILLLGTFDTVDEAAFNSAGLNDRIVKPFESNTFIQKIQSLLESNSGSESLMDSEIFSGETETNFLTSGLEDITPAAVEESDSGDDWVVDSPAPVDKSSDDWDSFTESKSNDNENALESSLEGWGMNIPGQIGGSNSDMEMDLPGVITESKNIKVEAKSEPEFDIVHEVEEENLPTEADLDYPDVTESEPEKGEQSVSKEIDNEPTSAFLSTDEFNLDDEEDDAEDLDKTDPHFKLPTEELVSEIEEDADDFWATDDSSVDVQNIDLAEELEEDESEDYHAEPDFGSTSEVTQDSISLEPLADPRENQTFKAAEQTNPQQPAASVEINKDEIVAKIMEELKPALHELIESYCKETIESVAWQIIPDLAENLIRSEIKEIKESSTSV